MHRKNDFNSFNIFEPASTDIRLIASRVQCHDSHTKFKKKMLRIKTECSMHNVYHLLFL